ERRGSLLLLQSGNLASQHIAPLLQVRPMRRREAYAVLLEVLDRIVAEVRKPRLGLASEFGANRQLVLIDLPRNARLFEPFRIGRPAYLAVELDFRIEQVGPRLGRLFGANR